MAFVSSSSFQHGTHHPGSREDILAQIFSVNEQIKRLSWQIQDLTARMQNIQDPPPPDPAGYRDGSQLANAYKQWLRLIESNQARREELTSDIERRRDALAQLRNQLRILVEKLNQVR